MENEVNILEFEEQEYKEFFSWLLDKNIDKVEREYDVSRSLNLENSYIYYTPEIKEFFETKAMKRLGKIGQIPNVSLSNANCIQNRLEHCKGAYQKILDFYILQFHKLKWRQKNNTQESKLKVLADIMDMASHDIGHNIGSHALEHLIGKKGAHEVIGDRILHENEEIIKIFNNIHPKLNEYLDIVKSEEYDLHTLKEGNIDFDRFDFLSRDSLYSENENGFQVKGQSIIEILDQINRGCETYIITNEGKEINIPVYSYKVFPQIEVLMQRRVDGYENLYISKNTKPNDYILEEFCKTFLKSDEIKAGKSLKNYLIHLSTSSIENIDLNQYLDWNDIKFYNSVFDIVENSKYKNIRDFAKLCIPVVDSMIGMIQTQIFPNMNPSLDENGNEINIENEFESDEDKEFYLKVKDIIKNKDEKYYKNEIYNQCFGVYFYKEDERNVFLNNLKNTYGISDKEIDSLIQWNFNVKVYNPKEPIFILGEDFKIYTFDEYPKRKLDLTPHKAYGILGIESKCLIEGVPLNRIKRLKKVFNINENKIDFSDTNLDTRLFSEILDKKMDKDERE